MQMVAKSGGLKTFLDSGARMLESACGFCIGNSMSPGTNGVSIRTANRNFEGRSGTPSAQVYLSSPATAAACAIKGEITDPRDLRIPYHKVGMPTRYLIDDSMIIKPIPKAQRAKVTVAKGPNIKGLPDFPPMPATIKGVVTKKVGNEITTDHIMPAGKYLKYRSNVPEYAKHVLEPVDAQFGARAMANKEKGIANIVVAGLSYGQGSSREHAALCPAHLGLRIVLAKSIERIHKANLVNFGILPLAFENEADYELFADGDEIEVADVRARLERGQPLTLKNVTKGKDIKVKYELSERQRKMLLAGGLLPFTVGS
jgi:aconitate hydratase